MVSCQTRYYTHTLLFSHTCINLFENLAMQFHHTPLDATYLSLKSTLVAQSKPDQEPIYHTPHTLSNTTHAATTLTVVR